MKYPNPEDYIYNVDGKVGVSHYAQIGQCLKEMIAEKFGELDR